MVRTTRLSIELNGGIGYTWEYPVHLFLKRSMHDRASAGLPSLHRMRAADLADW